MDILKEVVFIILMRSILNAAPSYLQEKREMIDMCRTGDEAAGILLDSQNKALYQEYKTIWRIGTK